MTKIRANLILKRFFRNKLNYIIIILIGICFAFSIMINSLTYSAREYFKEDILNFVGYRQFSIVDVSNKDELLKKLNSMPEIEGAFDNYGYVSYWDALELSSDNSDELPGFWLNGVVGTVKSIVGEDLSTSNELEMVCPSVYYSDTDKSNKIDLTSYVGKYLTLRYINDNNPKEFKVKLVGLYDNDRLNQNYRRCYINYKSLEKMNKEIATFSNLTIYYELKNIIDSEKVSNDLHKIGYWPDPVVYLDSGLAIDSLDMLTYIGYGLFAVTMFIVACIISFNISKNKNNVALNKVFGYSNKNLILNYLIESINLFITSVISAIIFLFVVLRLFKKYIPLYYKTFKYIEILISPTAFCGALMTILVLCLLIGIISFVTSINNNINSALRRGE